MIKAIKKRLNNGLNNFSLLRLESFIEQEKTKSYNEGYDKANKDRQKKEKLLKELE